MKNLITDKVKEVTCSNWQNRISGEETTSEMVQLFLTEPQVQEYCLTHNYPSLQQLEEIADDVEKMGVIINRSSQSLNPTHLFAFGNSKVKVEFTGYAVGQITARHNAIVEVEKSPESIVIINLYDNAETTNKEEDKLKIIRQ